jgi:hypothetical protein
VNLFELFVKIGVDDQASGKLADISGKLGNGLKTAAKIGTAAVGAAAAGITALTKAAVDNYAEYEQLVGGVETLFKTSSDKVMEYAENAYKTAGLSANEYMSTVTSFSASLLQSLGGDTEAAAKYADMAITDMGDNANKMGTSMEMIQNAYQGFAKQNYTMLDNLKLGYGGTQEEMKRLIADAAKLSDTVDAQDMSFANIVKAINVVQTKMGITGTTAKEAGTTIQGSVASMKSAWTNLLTGLANGNANIEQLVDNLVTTVIGDGTESNLGVLGNILPAVKTALNGASSLVSKALPKIIGIIPDIINNNLPVLAEAAISIIQSLIDGISQNQEMLFETIFGVITYLAESFITMLPQIVQLGLNLIVSLANGIADSLPELIPTIMDVILQIVDTLTNPENLQNLLQAALSIVTQLAWGLVNSIPQLIDSVLVLVENIVNFLLDPQTLSKLIMAAIEIVIALGIGLVEAIPKLITATARLVAGIVGYFINYDWSSLGKNLVDGFKRGIQNAWTNLKKWFKNLFSDLIGIAKKILGIASPSKVFKKIGGFTAEGFGEGFEDEFAHVKDGMENALNFDDASVGINASIRKVGAESDGLSYGGTSFGTVNININGANIHDDAALADMVAERLQMMAERQGAVYA